MNRFRSLRPTRCAPIPVTTFGERRWRSASVVMLLVLTTAIVSTSNLFADDTIFLSDPNAGLQLQHEQQWGDFGLDRAASARGGTGSVLQVGETKYERGLGHHANGEIAIDLRGRYTKFRCLVGVQWQGGQKGSVVFRVAVDGEVKFETGPMSDSDPVRPVDVPLIGARQLRLTANDAGDGIGCDMANWLEARLVVDPTVPHFGSGRIVLGDESVATKTAAATGFTLIAGDTGPQVAVIESAGRMTVSVNQSEMVRFEIPVRNAGKPFRILADVGVLGHGQAQVELSLDGEGVSRTVEAGEIAELQTEPVPGDPESKIELSVRGVRGEAAVSWSNLRCVLGDQVYPIPMIFHRGAEAIPPPALPNLRPGIEQELIEWDWRLQDGIGTAREPRSWPQAVSAVLEKGDLLIEILANSNRHTPCAVTADGTRSVPTTDLLARWKSVRDRYEALSVAGNTSDAEWEPLWQQAHQVRRQIVLTNPLAQFGPLVFVKRVPSSFSHQLTQYSGRCARPGGGVFVLAEPGKSMRCRQLADLPTGSYLHPDVSWDGRRILFSFCETDPAATDWRTNDRQFYHLYEISSDGSGLRQLTDGPFDDFSPRYLPNGKILFVSTRRGGFHRCGRGPCPVYTMAVCEADGSNPRVISFHETHEWDPAVLHDGRVIYTRWDYVDRHAVHYQQLWAARPDGSDVRAFYGNNTLNPVGVWEARPIPRSPLVMATAAAHHAMTAGSIILLDVSRGIDGLDPIERITPDVLFPESESPVQRWSARAGVPVRPEVPAEERRWPGHCYRTPYPLSEDFFLAAYSYEPLIGEPHANPANMFGIYLVDRLGNKELLYRDVAIGSQWPMPLTARPCPPALPSLVDENQPQEGTFLLQDVYASWPQLANTKVGPQEDTVTRLRIVQVLPKTTPNANTPRVGLANASPGKQVLGTVPVEPDGSAYFRAPAGIPLAFQALDERGMAIQTMRSLTYLQPGEQASCVGCHEHRTTAPTVPDVTQAGRREPSSIKPGPDGSRPLNYARLVQPVLDQHCVKCHGGEKTDGGVNLTGEPDGPFTRSYNALAPLVAYSEWKGSPQANHEPLTHPNQFGARASRLTQLLLKGHEGVKLSDDDFDRLITWMDSNALFYGTFDPEDQRRQQRGERIAGPALE